MATPLKGHNLHLESGPTPSRKDSRLPLLPAAPLGPWDGRSPSPLPALTLKKEVKEAQREDGARPPGASR
jgi:hypothetical protein